MSFDEMRRELRQQVLITARRTAIEWERQVQAGAPVGESGDLKRSVRMRDEPTANGFIVRGKADTEYAEYVSDGTRPHVITPRTQRRIVNGRRRGGVLRFAVGGRTVYATKVNHPGTRPNDFWTRPLQRLPDTIQRIWNQVVA